MKENKKSRLSSLKTPKAQQEYMENLAMEEAERRILDHSATSQLLCHFLSLATEKAHLENERLKKDLEVANAKIKQMEDNSMSSELYKEAIEAFKIYSGQNSSGDDIDD